MFHIYANVNVGNSSTSIANGDELQQVVREVTEMEGGSDNPTKELEVILMKDGDIFYQDGTPVVLRLKL